MEHIFAELLKAAEEVEAAQLAEEAYRWSEIGRYPDEPIPAEVREKWLADLSGLSKRKVAARKELQAAIAKAREAEN